MIRVVILGSGNVAIHLAQGLTGASGVELVQYYSRSGNNNSYFPVSVKRTENLDRLEDADLYVIAVKDEAIEGIGHHLSGRNGLVVHTAGTISIDALASCPRRGVLYPVQTFSKDRPLDWTETPLALETALPEDMVFLKRFASLLSEKVFEIDSRGRKNLHLAAVFANNFSNHMFALSKEVCLEYGLPFELVKPLILETARKVMVLEPEDAQTGPARRQDEKVMNQQSSQLDQEKKEIYSLLSGSIARRYGSEKKE
jgi:predicted short-subunit dehydrogenase-like oxidoreductase (DUF2520 family)